MTAQNKVYFGKPAGYLLQRQTEILAVVRVEQRKACCRKQDGTVNARAKLVGTQREVFSQPELATMSNLGHITKAKRCQVAYHAPGGNFWD